VQHREQTTHPNSYYQQYKEEKPSHQKHDKAKKKVPKTINIRRTKEIKKTKTQNPSNLYQF
jgi:hypothetical protein